MRLGVVYIPDTVNAVYRARLPMMALRARGHEVVEVKQEGRAPLPLGELMTCELVHIHRLVIAPDGEDTIARLHDAGIAVGLDDDDNSEAAPPELDRLIGEGSVAAAQRDFARMLERASEVDLCTTPSPDLAERFAAAGADNVHVIDNYLPGEFNRVDPLGHEGLVIGWHGCLEHRLDAQALGLEATLRRVLDAHPDVHVVTIGGVDLEIDHERYRHEDTVAFDALTQRLADFDIGIVPLADTAFSRGRSNVKAREYAAASVPWLASPVGAYGALGKDQGGRLVEDDEWPAALDELIGSSRDRARMRKRARKWAERETIWRMADVWERTFLDTIADVRAIA